jgi:glycosyltransferase involved in cell wall biosynthesis
MRILQIQTYLRSERVNPRAGGKSRISLMLARYLVEAGHEVAVFPWPERIWGKTAEFAVSADAAASVFPTLALPRFRKILPDAFRLSRTRFFGGDRHSLFQDMCFLEGLSLAIERFEPDILHCQQTESDIPPFLRILKKSVPALLTHHSGRSGHYLDVYDRIVFLSRSMQEEVSRRSGYRKEKSQVIYIPISDEFLRGIVVPAEARAGIVCVGGLKDAKGVDLLLAAYQFSRPLRNHPLHLCGTGPDEKRYREYATQHRLPVVFHGRVSTPEIRQIVSRAKLLVNPSRMEGFSVALLEALACGTPVVGWADQVNELAAEWRRPVGFPFDGRSQSAEDLAALIERALADPVGRTASRKDLSRLARESFSMERYGSEIVRVYAEMREGKQG